MRDNLFTAKGEYPFSDAIGAGIKFIEFEAGWHVPQNCQGKSQILGPYTAEASSLIQCTPLEGTYDVLNIGARVGIPSLAAFGANPHIRIVAAEEKEGLLEVAKYNFHQKDLDISHYTGNDIVKRWLDNFREKSDPFKERISFVHGTIKTTKLPGNSFDVAIAEQYIHWLKDLQDMSETFGQIHTCLRDDGALAWNAGSRFLQTPGYPASMYSVRGNQFFLDMMDDISKQVKLDDSYVYLVPKYQLSNIKEITEEVGFITKPTGTYLLPYPTDLMKRTTFPAMAREHMGNISDTKKDMIIKKAIKKVEKTKSPEDDRTHIYETMTNLLSRKVA